MINLDIEGGRVEQKEITRLKSGVEKYQTIMKKYWSVDITKDWKFQRLYNGFYRVRQKSREWYTCYYEMLENLKIHNCSFDEILQELKTRTNRIEASFASKMHATRNLNSPIIDKWILKNLDLKLPYSYERNRFEKITQLYKKITEWYEKYASSEEGVKYIKLFNKICPESDISNIKKIDFILWQTRQK